MIFRQLFDNESSTYTYLLASNGEAILIDPVIEKMPIYKQLLAELKLTLKYAVDTHTHADHITALGELRREFGCATMLGKQTKAECVSDVFSDNDVLSVGDLSIKTIYTPGHTDDSYSFYLEYNNEKYVFTGDTLLIRGTGRTDFQNGNASDQYDSINNRLLVLDDGTRLYPGHDYKGMTMSTVGEEKQFNPRVTVEDKDAYIQLMNNLNLPDPKMMDVAVPANIACGKSNK